ncbi:MAG: tRNA (adenosine(37)-N6)-threonylcarbamoyltransferase complex ATPase subunit type 1 TsaE [Planctomycetes bacterium]|nr:tRNA (adenosine(37)-N6)-threonylcarbamoyltransferase complex ATPase subunit type 1 TsaE [Planctomycetota bacterium]
MKSISLDVNSLAETEAFGRRLAAHLFPGAVVALIGPLGAGKTNLVRAIAEGLGIGNPAVVNSPTFVLIQEYEARLPIYHFDAYRLAGDTEFADLGVHEYFQGNGVCLVEWADKVPACLPAERLEIRITITGEQSRRFDVTALGARYEAIVMPLAA